MMVHRRAAAQILTGGIGCQRRHSLAGARELWPMLIRKPASGFVAIVAIAFAMSLAGQTSPNPAANSPRFDVVSIRINREWSARSEWNERCRDGRWTATNVSIATLVNTAFGLVESQVVGIPAWNSRPQHQFNIAAICPTGTTGSQLQPMLQAMLANRFDFKAHYETRMLPVRTLELAHNGPKMSAAANGCISASSAQLLQKGERRCGQFYHSMSSPNGRGPVAGLPLVFHIQAWSVTAADLARFLAPLGVGGQPPLVDDTGLGGYYDVDLHYQVVVGLKDADGKPIDQVYELAKAIKGQLGLIYNYKNLKRMAVHVLVIDSVSLPTPN